MILPLCSNRVGSCTDSWPISFSFFIWRSWSSFYAAAFAAQLLLYAFAIYGAWLDEHEGGAHRRESGDLFARFARVALTFLVLNASAVAGLWMFALNKKVWR